MTNNAQESLEQNPDLRVIEEYKKKFGETIAILKSTWGDTGWWVIGSNARRGLLSIEPSAEDLHKNYQLNDIDILVTENKEQLFEKLRKQNLPLPLGGGVLGTYLRIGPIDAETGLPSHVSFFVSKSFSADIPPEVFKTLQANTLGTVFPTVPPETLIALNKLGGVREKDISRVAELQDYIDDNPTPGVDLSSYQFLKEIENKKRPLTDRIAKSIDRLSMYKALRRRFPRVTDIFVGVTKKILYRRD